MTRLARRPDISMRRRLTWGALVALCVVVPTADAHQLATSSGTWQFDAARGVVSATVIMDITAVLPVTGLRPPKNPARRPAWRQRTGPRLAQLFGESVDVSIGGRACPSEGGEVAGRRQEDMVAFSVRWRCDGPLEGELRVRLAFMSKISDDHQHMATLGPDEVLIVTLEEPEIRTTFPTLARPSKPAQGVAQPSVPPSAPRLSFGAMMWEGVAHIGTGWDHILFVLALLLGIRTARAAVLVVTAFTVAHSLTLALSVLDVVDVDAAVVEAAIAASVIYVAVENLWREPRHRWAWALGFGLIHGLGFAGYLKELDLFSHGVVGPLVAFNVGVEAGQLGIVAVAFPLMVAGRRWDRWPKVSAGMSLAMAGFGAYWLITRTLLS